MSGLPLTILEWSRLTGEAPGLRDEGAAIVEAAMAFERAAGVDRTFSAVSAASPEAGEGWPDVLTRMIDRTVEPAIWEWIAPDDRLPEVLAETAAMIAAAGVDVRLNNVSPATAAIFASKRETCRDLASRSIPCVSTIAACDRTRRPGRWVVKPDRGCGCEQVQIVDSERLLESSARIPNAVVQPYLRGPSYGVLVRLADGRVFPEAKQDIVADDAGGLSYRGGWIARRSPSQDVRELASLVREAIPDRDGWIGIDFIRTERGPVVLEVNPRRTTSMVGLAVQRRDRDITAVRFAKNGAVLDQPSLGEGQ